MVLPPLQAIPQDIVAALDYERHARAHLDENAWTFLGSGAADEITRNENQAAFQALRLRSRVLADVRGGHTRLELFGQTFAHPIFLAPIAYQHLFHDQGERAVAQGAGVMGACMVLSTLASTTLEAVAQAASAPMWLQLYLQHERTATLALVQRAQKAGYRALVVTVDAPLAGVRNREQRLGFHLPPGVAAVNLSPVDAVAATLSDTQSVVFDGLMDGAPTWADVEWLLAVSPLPVVLKGILGAEDAAIACSLGAAGIVVSNHGGRILDTLPATIEALPAVVAAIDGRIPVLLDGGIRRGTDVFKALALGATAVLVGRPYVHALATAGALGVAHLIRILREELEVAMALCGCPTLDAITCSAVLMRGGDEGSGGEER